MNQSVTVNFVLEQVITWVIIGLIAGIPAYKMRMSRHYRLCLPWLLTVLCIIVLTATSLPRAQASAATFRVYLGFDDGPVAGPTDRILDVLKRYGVKATFFIEGSHVATNEDILRREIQEGHHLGNHLWLHELAVMSTNHPSTAILLARYQSTQDAIHRAFGETLWTI